MTFRLRAFSSLVAAALLLAAFQVPAVSAASRNLSRSAIERLASPAVVLVSAYAGVTRSGVPRKVSVGSAFFVSDDGYLLTSRHVVDEPGATYTVDDGSGEVPATVVYRDASADFAVLRVSGTRHPALAFSEDAAGLRDRVVSVGNAEGQRIDSVSSGRVTGRNVSLRVEEQGKEMVISGMLRTSARQFPGDSGGPVLSRQGQVVGIVTAIGTGADRRVSYVLPIAAVSPFLALAGILGR